MNVGHERLGNYGISSWCLAQTEPFWGPTLEEAQRFYPEPTVLHQTRNPVLTVISQHRMRRQTILRLFGSERAATAKLVDFTIAMHERCEALTDNRYRVEDAYSKFPYLREVDVSRNTKRNRLTPNWSQVPDNRIQALLELGARYGYTEAEMTKHIT